MGPERHLEVAPPLSSSECWEEEMIAQKRLVKQFGKSKRVTCKVTLIEYIGSS